MEAKKESPQLLLFTGAASGVLADSIMHPIDTIRARLQIEKVGQQQYKGTADAFQSIIRKEGWRYLYKGFPIVVAATIPAHALYFYGYEISKRNLSNTIVGNGWVNHFTSGLVADISGAMIWTPMDVIKQRLQVQQAQITQSTTKSTFYRGSFHACQVIFKEEGIKGFYKGFLPSLATFGPLVGIYFATYEQTKKQLSQSLSLSLPLPLHYQLGAGFFAGTVAAAVTCPLDVIKTRIQVARANEKTYNGILDGFKRILREEGPRAFVKGMGARILWIAPGNAITIASYEQLKSLFSSF